jgi:hypothetical protein
MLCDRDTPVVATGSLQLPLAPLAGFPYWFRWEPNPSPSNLNRLSRAVIQRPGIGPSRLRKKGSGSRSVCNPHFADLRMLPS